MKYVRQTRLLNNHHYSKRCLLLLWPLWIQQRRSLHDDFGKGSREVHWMHQNFPKGLWSHSVSRIWFGSYCQENAQGSFHISSTDTSNNLSHSQSARLPLRRRFGGMHRQHYRCSGQGSPLLIRCSASEPCDPQRVPEPTSSLFRLWGGTIHPQASLRLDPCAQPSPCLARDPQWPEDLCRSHSKNCQWEGRDGTLGRWGQGQGSASN